jgi:hypothetical protein
MQDYLKQDIVSLCTYIIETEEEDYKYSMKENHVYEIATHILENI